MRKSSLFGALLFMMSGLGSATASAQSIIDLYPAIPSPNHCTETWGKDFFLRENGYCQACNTVNAAYKKFYKICEFTDYDPVVNDADPFYIVCQSTKTGKGAYRECVGDSTITKAEISQEYSADKNACRFDVTWGFFEDVLWASSGCIAKFEVCYRGHPCHLDQNDDVIDHGCKAQKPKGWISYRVQPGDSLSALARRTGSATDTLRRVNCIDNPNWIVSGTTIFLPRYPDPVVVPPVTGPDVIIVDPETDRPEEVGGGGDVVIVVPVGDDNDDNNPRPEF